MVAGVLLLGLSGGLIVREYGFAQRGGVALFESRYEAADFSLPIEAGPIVAGAHELPWLVRVSAPVDNAWMNIGVTALDVAGNPAGQCKLTLAHRHGEKHGLAWRWGARTATERLPPLRPGAYRLKITVQAATGASARSDTDDSSVGDAVHAGKPLQISVFRPERESRRVSMGALIACAAVGGALVLRALALRFGLSAQTPKPTKRPGRKGRPDTQRAAPAALVGATGERLVFLDGLRGIASVGVLLCHFAVPEHSKIADALIRLLPGAATAVLRHGDLGVEIFFVLSGFVIACTLRDRRIDGSVVWRFAVRRSLRLDPPYHLALFLLVATWAATTTDSFYGAWEKMQGVPGAFANMFYVQYLLIYPPLLSIAWTLCLEIQFYLALVALAAVAQWLEGRRAAKEEAVGWRTALVFAPIALGSAVTWYAARTDFTFAGVWFRFFLGVLTFWTVQGRAPRWLLASALGTLLAASLATQDLRGGVAVATAALIFLASVRGAATRWLGGRGWQYFGKISYSLYLTHLVVGLPLMNRLWRSAPQSDWVVLAMMATGVVASVAAAHLVHVFYERPSQALSRAIRF